MNELPVFMIEFGERIQSNTSSIGAQDVQLVELVEHFLDTARVTLKVTKVKGADQNVVFLQGSRGQF